MLHNVRFFLLLSTLFCLQHSAFGQLIINEGSNKNYSTIVDEYGEAEDWIEIVNTGNDPIDLFQYSLSDDANPGKWRFPHHIIQPGEFLLVFCSGRNQFATSPFVTVLSDSSFAPAPGWNGHQLSQPFVWDGVSNVIVNVCSYNDFYTDNTIHRLSATSFISSAVAAIDGGSACPLSAGGVALRRPNIRLNNAVIGQGTETNSPTDYPSPYGNWYWSARQQYLYLASELSAAGLVAGSIDSLAFDVVSTNGVPFAFFAVSLANSGTQELTSSFVPSTGSFLHTNFKIDGAGETIRLFNPADSLMNALTVSCGNGYDISIGAFPDATASITKFATPTPGFSNNNALAANNYTPAPVFSTTSGTYNNPFSVSLSVPSTPNATIYYTLDGSTPDSSSSVWAGSPIFIFQSAVLRAKAYLPGFLPSTTTSASYLFNVNHNTPVISVISDQDNLFGPTGMFDNPFLDLLKPAAIDYFDESQNHSLVFTRKAGIIMDGGWGSRGLPQRPFRIKFDHSVLGEGPVNGNFIPNRANRNQYSDFYLRNGSNQFLILPHKDAAQVKMMGEGTHTGYAAWRPVSVYINGAYWGLYELREKFDAEMFAFAENAAPDSLDILSSSAQYGFVLRAVEGSVQPFYAAYNQYVQLNPADSTFWNQADSLFDLANYIDYIIAEVWMNNADWAFNYNNLKLYRSNATQFRWRYCLMDMEFGLLPSPVSDLSCQYDLLAQLIQADPNNPHLNIWLRGMQNDRFRNYFINRYADLMNSLYLPERLTGIENDFFNQTVVEMANEFQRWGDPNTVPAQVNSFYQHHLTFLDELSCRPEQARNDVQQNFNLPKQVSVSLDITPATAGQINISSISPDDYPWSGVYFDGVPIQIEARANPGFQFSHWESNALLTDTLNPVFNDTLTASAVTYHAHFSPVVGITEKENTLFSLYPNPTRDRLLIVPTAQQPDAPQLFITDALGKPQTAFAVFSSGKNMSLDVSSLSPGYYILRYVTAEGKTYPAGFVKQ